MALSYALAQRRAEGKPIDGHWYRAQKFIEDFQNYTWSFQHRDGSFSTGWFKEKKFSGDIDQKLYTTGHILEWLVFSLPEEQLNDPRITRSVDYILNLMLSAPNYDRLGLVDTRFMRCGCTKRRCLASRTIRGS